MPYLIKHILQHIIYHKRDCLRLLLNLALHLRNLFAHLGRKIPRGFPFVARAAAGPASFTSEASRVSGKVFGAFTVSAGPFGALAQRLHVSILALYPMFLLMANIVLIETAILTLRHCPTTQRIGALPIFRFEIAWISLYRSRPSGRRGTLVTRSFITPAWRTVSKNKL